MAYASGSNAEFNYCVESSWGTQATATSGTWYKVRHTGESITGSTEQIRSQELRGDRMMGGPSRGAVDVRGSFNIEFSHASFDDFLESVLFNAWDDSSKSVTADTISLSAAAHTISDSAGGFTPFEVGDLIKLSGAANEDNNSYYIVSAVSSTTITVDHVWNDVAVTESSGATITVRCSELKVGSTRKSVTLEKWFSDIDKGVVFDGCVADTLALEIRPNAIITGSFGVAGKGQSTETSRIGTPVDKAATSPFEGSESDMVVKEGGATVGLITGLSLNVSNNLGSVFVLGDNEKADVPEGRCQITGTSTVLFEDLGMLNKWLDKTPSSLDILLASAAKEDGCYRIFLPKIEYSGDTPTIGGENEVQLNMPWSAYYDPDEDNEIIIQR